MRNLLLLALLVCPGCGTSPTGSNVDDIPLGDVLHDAAAAANAEFARP